MTSQMIKICKKNDLILGDSKITGLQNWYKKLLIRQ